MRKRILALTMALMATLSVVGVAGAQTFQSGTITDVVIASDNFETLEVAVVEAGLAGTLAGEGPILVFAPTDDAFAALPDGALEALLSEPGLTTLTDVLTYHVVTGPTLEQFLEASEETSYTLTALNGGSLQLEETGPTTATVNGIEFTSEDLVVTDNGLIIVIDQVLLPPDFAVPTPVVTEVLPASVVDVVVASEDHTTLGDAVIAADLAAALSDPASNFAVFAPTDDAFAALPEGALDTLLAEPSLATLTGVLTYHIVSEQTPTEDGTYTLETLNGATVEIEYMGGTVVSVNGNAVAAEVIASNGAVFVIDAVLLPPDFTVPVEPTPVPEGNTITDIVVANDDFTRLETAVVAAGLAETLASPGPFTVFAPTDAAFASLDPAVLETALADPAGLLTSVLLYHVVAGEVPAADVVTLSNATTVQGSDVTIEVINGEVILNGSVRVIRTDIQAANGIIHVIDAVLLPPTASANPAGYPQDPALIIPSTVESFIIGEEIVVPIPEYTFPEGANGSFQVQFVQYPNGVDSAPVLYKSAQHWASSGSTFVFGVDSAAIVDVPSYIIVTPFTYEQSINAATGATEFSYTPVPDALNYYTEAFTIQ